MKTIKTLFWKFFGEKKENNNDFKEKEIKKILLANKDFFWRVIEIYPVDKENKMFWKWILALDEKGNIIREKPIEGINQKEIDSFYIRLEKNGFFENNLTIKV